MGIGHSDVRFKDKQNINLQQCNILEDIWESKYLQAVAGVLTASLDNYSRSSLKLKDRAKYNRSSECQQDSHFT